MQGVEKVLRWKEKKNYSFVVCQKKVTRQSMDLPCAKEKAHDKVWICRVFFLSRVFLSWPTAKLLFAVCTIESTRQTMKHTANI